MFNLKFSLVMFCLSVFFMAQAEVASRQDLALYRWQARLLLIFTPSLEAPSWQTQAAALQLEVDALAERRLQVLVITANSVWRLHFLDADRAAPDAGKVALLPAADLPDASALRKTQRIGEASAVLLLGLDGEVKARYALPVALGEVFGEIDQMPMRQWERQQR